MTAMQISEERSMSSPSEHVYRLLADYQNHHPNFLPSAFSDYKIEEGGVGAGTIISFSLALGGRSSDYRLRVDEPEPGRVLTEINLETGGVTTFTVSPIDADRSTVRIGTTFTTSPGMRGLAERLMAPRMLRRLYAEELELLEAYASSSDQQPAETEV